MWRGEKFFRAAAAPTRGKPNRLSVKERVGVITHSKRDDGVSFV